MIEFALAVGVCVLALLLCPAPTGGYSATHGPVTALRSLQAAVAIFLSMLASLLMLLDASTRCGVAPATVFSIHSRCRSLALHCALLC